MMDFYLIEFTYIFVCANVSRNKKNCVKEIVRKVGIDGESGLGDY